MTYAQKLKDPRWQKRRLEIMNRDNWACQKCQDTTSTLNVHHKEYIKGRDPWDYPDSHLVTLCEWCHENIHNPKALNIYLAGKIAKRDWRHGLVGGNALRNGEYDKLEGVIFGRHNYAGPFFVSCDHGCGHAKEKHHESDEIGHGRSLNGCTQNASDYGVPAGRDAAFESCRFAINDCDLFFAWIEDTTCYGTLVEIGYAHALGKPIFIACPNQFPDDLWFSAKTSSYTVTTNTTPESALRESISALESALRFGGGK